MSPLNLSFMLAGAALANQSEVGNPPCKVWGENACCNLESQTYIVDPDHNLTKAKEYCQQLVRAGECMSGFGKASPCYEVQINSEGIHGFCCTNPKGGPFPRGHPRLPSSDRTVESQDDESDKDIAESGSASTSTVESQESDKDVAQESGSASNDIPDWNSCSEKGTYWVGKDFCQQLLAQHMCAPSSCFPFKPNNDPGAELVYCCRNPRGNEKWKHGCPSSMKPSCRYPNRLLQGNLNSTLESQDESDKDVAESGPAVPSAAPSTVESQDDESDKDIAESGSASTSTVESQESDKDVAQESGSASSNLDEDACDITPGMGQCCGMKNQVVIDTKEGCERLTAANQCVDYEHSCYGVRLNKHDPPGYCCRNPRGIKRFPKGCPDINNPKCAYNPTLESSSAALLV